VKGLILAGTLNMESFLNQNQKEMSPMIEAQDLGGKRANQLKKIIWRQKILEVYHLYELLEQNSTILMLEKQSIMMVHSEMNKSLGNQNWILT